MSDIAFVMAVGKGKTLDKSYYLAKSIKQVYEDAEIYAYVAEEEKPEISQGRLSKIGNYANLIYGDIPMKEYIFTVKHRALILAGEMTNKKYLVCLDSDMLMMNELSLPKGEMFVCPVDIGNTSWGREEARPLWEKLYKKIGAEMPKNKLLSLIDKYAMFPYYNGGFVITSDHKFGRKWLDLTREIFKILPDMDSYMKGYSQQTKRRRLFTKIPYSHWTEQVTLTLLASKHKAKILPYEYDWPMNTTWRCPTNVKIMHYHDMRNLLKIHKKSVVNRLKEIGIYDELKYSTPFEYPRMIGYQVLRGMKVRLGKF